MLNAGAAAPVTVDEVKFLAVNRALVVGRTAVHARTLAAGAARKAAVCLGLGLVLFGITSQIWLRLPGLVTAWMIVAVPAACVLAWRFRRFEIDYRKARVGVRAEERTAHLLARCPVAAVVNGVVLGRGDIDHVVLGPCLVVVETKHGRGRLDVDRSGALTVDGRRLPRDPVAQARGNAERLSRELRRSVQALVVVCDAEGGPIRLGSVLVTSLRDLPACIDSFPNVVDPVTARRLAADLPVAAKAPR